MESLRRVTGVAAPLMRANIDTDQIIPTRFLARMSEDGLGEGLFAEWAVNADGSRNAGFALNRAPWDQAAILIAGPMFGCGSSREAAPRALRQRGIRAVVATSFGDTFFNNCFRNGLAPVRLAAQEVEALARSIETPGAAPAACTMTVDLERQELIDTTGRRHAFTLPPLLGRMLLEGLDEIALTRMRQAEIERYRRQDRTARPWAYRS